MAGAVTLRTLTVVTIPSHHKRWGRVSSKIRHERGRCYSDMLKIERAG
jgi:hypothetical protein